MTGDTITMNQHVLLYALWEAFVARTIVIDLAAAVGREGGNLNKRSTWRTPHRVCEARACAA